MLEFILEWLRRSSFIIVIAFLFTSLFYLIYRRRIRSRYLNRQRERCYRDKDWQQLLEICTRHLEIESGNREVIHDAIVAYFHMGNLSSAFEMSKKLLPEEKIDGPTVKSLSEKNPRYAQFLQILAEIYFVEGNSDLSCEILLNIKDMHADFPNKFFLLAQIEKKKQNYSQAVEYLRKEMKNFPQKGDYLLKEVRDITRIQPACRDAYAFALDIFQHKNILQKQIDEAVEFLLQDRADEFQIRFLSEYVLRHGFKDDKPAFRRLVGKLGLILFEANDISLCESLFAVASEYFPADSAIQRHLDRFRHLNSLEQIKNITGNISSVNRLNARKNDFGKMEPDPEKSFELGEEYDISSEIENVEKKDIKAYEAVPDPEKTEERPSDAGVDDEKTVLQPARTVRKKKKNPFIDMLTARYTFKKKIGEGGMGGVFKALDKQLSREVAIKFMNKQFLTETHAVKRFIREAKAAAALNHPGVITIFDVGTEKNPYIVMEFIQGKTLKQIMRKGKISPNKALHVLKRVAEILEYANGKGVIHRDVKPDNIMICRDKSIKILDFGLAKTEFLPNMTVQKQILGTPLYMSPEQIRGEPVDCRADIYAWGTMSFEILTGKRPFPSGDLNYHHMHTPPPSLMDIEDTIPARIDELVRKCMAKDRNARFESFGAVLTELNQIL